MNPRTKIKVFLIVGFVLILVGVIFASCFRLIFNKILFNALVISESSPLFEEYTAPTTPAYASYYFFNVTNPDEIKNYGAKPILEETGPYVYNMQFNKVNYVFDETAGTLSYSQKYTYFFNQDRSVGTEKDEVTMLNAIMVVVAALTYDNFMLNELLWPEVEAGMNLFETHTVEELLFKGWELPIFNYDFSNSPFSIMDATSGLQGTLYEILLHFDIDISYLKDNTVGFMKGLNGSDTGLLKVNTGVKGMDEYLFIKEWNNLTSLDVWHDQYCDMINGTDGSQFPPGVTKDELLRMFAPQFCRSSYMTYDKDVVLQNAIPAYRFVVPPEVLMAPSENEDNRCFCSPIPTDDVNECPENSIVNYSPCFYGFPVVVSNPHFYQSDGIELAKFEGLSPSQELHEIHIDVEPTSGLALSGTKKLQINLPLRRYGNLPSFQNVPEAIFPIFWIDENGIISKKDAIRFNKALTLPFIIVYSICGVLILVGLVFVGSGLVMYKRLKREKKMKR